MSRAWPFVAALFVGACSLFSAPKTTPAQRARAVDVAACVAKALDACANPRHCPEALACLADEGAGGSP